VGKEILKKFPARLAETAPSGNAEKGTGVYKTQKGGEGQAGRHEKKTGIEEKEVNQGNEPHSGHSQNAFLRHAGATRMRSRGRGILLWAKHMTYSEGLNQRATEKPRKEQKPLSLRDRGQPKHGQKRTPRGKGGRRKGRSHVDIRSKSKGARQLKRRERVQAIMEKGTSHLISNE